MAPEITSAPALDQPVAANNSRWTALFTLIFGMAMTLVVSGYQFGRGNHTVYLLDGLRITHPELLSKDWFVTQTLQYHAVFSRVTAMLMKAGLLHSGFLIGYLVLIVLWHIAWRRLVRYLGGDDRIYMMSVVLFYLSAAGISLGVFQFLQDGCFLPSNVSNIAIMWGITCWVGGKRTAAAIWLGIAGFFHLNYAVLSIWLWMGWLAWQLLDQWRGQTSQGVLKSRSFWIASALALIPSGINLGFAIPGLLRDPGMPMSEFIRTYIHFRHTHHFDPLHWPIGLWVAFLWPLPLWFIAAAWAGDTPIWRAAKRTFWLIMFLQIVAFLFAGVWFVHDSLVQLCFFRFSIFVKLMSCIGASMVFSKYFARPLLITIAAAGAVAIGVFFAMHGWSDNGPAFASVWDHRAAFAAFAILLLLPAIDQLLRRRDAFHIGASLALLAMCTFGWNTCLGFGMTPEPVDQKYDEVCEWAKNPANTPDDAIFLVPPQETDFRLYGERAIVVNFKHVPQLSGEILAWKARLLDVLGIGDKEIAELPHDYPKLLARLGELYEQRSAADLFATAKKYDVSYVVVNHSLGAEFDPLIVFHRADNPYVVYHVP